MELVVQNDSLPSITSRKWVTYERSKDFKLILHFGLLMSECDYVVPTDLYWRKYAKKLNLVHIVYIVSRISQR